MALTVRKFIFLIVNVSNQRLGARVPNKLNLLVL
jgi:hypothetical protein